MSCSEMTSNSEKMEQMMDPAYTDTELAKILSQGGPIPSLSASTDIHVLRRTLLERKRALTASAPPTSSDIEETDVSIPTRDGARIVVRIYRGPSSRGGPVMVMLHGGGWVLGGLDNEALLCRKWAEQFHGVSVNVDYRLAPEVKFPVPLYDCYDAVAWTSENPGEHGGDLSKGFVVAGISAGANMAATIAHIAREELQPALTGCYLSIPSLLSPQVVPERFKNEYLSREQNKDAPILNAGAIALFRKLYEDDPTSPLMSPVIFDSHENIPRTYLQVAGMDPLRDDGLIYEKILREEAGVETRMDLYPGLPHGFWSWWPEAEFSRKQQQDSIRGLGWLLGVSAH